MAGDRDHTGGKAKPAPDRDDPAEDLARLRRTCNALVRRLADREHELAGEIRRCREKAEALERELETLRGSRAWRAVTRLRRLDPRALMGRWGAGRRETGHAAGWHRDHRAAQYRARLAREGADAAAAQRLRERGQALKRAPLISVLLPVYRVDPAHLEAALESLRAQLYENWEACVVDDASGIDVARLCDAFDDPRVRVRRLSRNAGISAATNEAAAMAKGEYFAFLDHDDRLAPEALLEAALEIESSGADFVYTDEDYLDRSGERVYPHFKPDWSPDLLLSHNYVTHLVVVGRTLFERAGGLRSEYDGAQDYDFVLRATESAETIRHIPRVLYHWRTGEASTATNPGSKPDALERGRQAVEAALARRGRSGEVKNADVPYFYRVEYAVQGSPLVSIVVPFRDKADYLHCIVGDILSRSTYRDYEIIGISNQSAEPETFEAMRDLAGLDERVAFLEYNEPFNFAAIVNHGVRHCRGEHVVLLNNDIRLMTEDWIEALLGHSQHPETGAVGGKLYYPDGRVQHAGIIVGIGGYAGHSHKGFPAAHQGYFNRLQVTQNVSAVTGAFMMVEKKLFEEVGGFDAERFAIACNDVDFCLRLRERGYWNVFTPRAEARHVESASRGYEDTPEKQERYAAERARFAARHPRILEEGDPFYNPNLTQTGEDFSLEVAG